MRNYIVNIPKTSKTYEFASPKEVMVLLNSTDEPFIIKYKGKNLTYTKFLDYFAKGIV